MTNRPFRYGGAYWFHCAKCGIERGRGRDEIPEGWMHATRIVVTGQRIRCVVCEDCQPQPTWTGTLHWG